jgi:hypothetical protein
MALPLPNLDDRRWVDLVDEGRTLIPLYSPKWTDHNVHDPGITLVELLAWMAELDLYRINRVPASHVGKFLALVGIQPMAPRGARTVLALHAGVPHVEVPADVEIEARDLSGRWVVFRTLAAVTAVQLDLQAIQSGGSSTIEDLTGRWRRGEIVPLLGDEPAPGSALYLGFDRPLPPDVPVTIAFRLSGGFSGSDQRERILDEARRTAEVCPPPGPVYPCHCDVTHSAPAETPASVPASIDAVPPHGSVRTVWEIQIAPGVWHRLDAESGEITDDTRSLTLDGRVVIAAPVATVAARVGAARTPLHYLRCRVTAGSYDAAPALAHVIVNGVAVEQSESMATTWVIAKGAVVSGSLPSPGDERRLAVSWNDKGEIASLEFSTDEPRLRVLEFVAPSSTATGRVTVEAGAAGTGNGEPAQRLTLPRAAVSEGRVDLVAFESDGAVTWTARNDFDASGRTGSHFVLDAQQGLLTFGDGESGRRLPSGALVVARYRSTRGADGNLPAGRSWRIARTAHNTLTLATFTDILSGIAAIANPVPIDGGSAAETLGEATARAVDSVEQPLRAVTLADYEALALATPGVRLARVAARANLDPTAPCLQATGVVTVIIVPFLPRRQPFPTAGTRRAVMRYLFRRRLIGTRVVVVGPKYLEIAVRANVRPLSGVDPVSLRVRIVAALDRFFHPLTGGADGQGWPFGRDVYRSEVLQLLDEVPGVDHVLSLEFISGCSCHGPVCGNVCVGPIGLVSSGAHEIAIDTARG